MKFLKKFQDHDINEAVIDWETNNVKGFIHDVYQALDHMGPLDVDDLAQIGERFDIEVVNYDQFYRELPDELKPGAPGGGKATRAPFLALVNPVTHKIRMVMNMPLSAMMFNHFVSVLKHENTHIGQLQRSGGRRGESYDVRDKKKYFSDKGEIMAFAQNIVHDIMSKPGITTMSKALKEFTNHPLWKMEISKLDEVTKNRYKKYIYSYFELEFGKKNNPKN